MVFCMLDSFFKELPEWAIDALENNVDKNKKILKSLNMEQLNLLTDFFNDISRIGVNGFGYRVFFQNGNTSIFTVNKDWDRLVKIDGFLRVNLDFVKNELMFCAKNDIEVLIRSGDNVSGGYLSVLKGTSVNNAVVMYNYSCSKIEVFYLHCATPIERNFILNKCHLVQISIDKAKQALNSIMNSEYLKGERYRCLTRGDLSLCFSKKDVKPNTCNVSTEGKISKLSPAEIECLFYLKFGGSSSQIAQNIGRSESSVRDRIRSLKNKLNVSTKEELSSLARGELEFLTRSFVQENKRIAN
jgi:DNA-binding CsgD family transcriptional regulator